MSKGTQNSVVTSLPGLTDLENGRARTRAVAMFVAA